MKRPSANLDSGILAVIHRAGRVWRCLAANVKNGKPSITATRDIPVDRDSMLNAWLDQEKTAAVLCVLPASSVICRNCTLPDAAPQQLEQALQLQAEAHLLGVAPAHRVSMAVLPAAPGETNRSGLVVAWPESAGFALPPTTRPVEYVADIAAIAAIVNGQRPTDPVLWLDRADGSIALVITHAGGAIFRATREDTSSTDVWQQSVGRIVAETALSVGHTGSFVETVVRQAREHAASMGSGHAALVVPADLQSAAGARLNGAGTDATWWSTYGVAAGALLARTGQLNSLTHLLDERPIDAPSLVERAVTVMSRPRTAGVLVAVCLLAIFFGPLAANGLRLAILKLRFGDIDEHVRTAALTRNTVDLYQELQRQHSWPMTKLLADICTNTPVGIELESIRLEGGKEFWIGGTAIANQGMSAPQVVAQYQENLRKDNLFADIQLELDAPNNMGVHNFDISAKVSRPYISPEYPEERDFRALTLADRLYGKRAGAAQGTVAMDSNPDDASGLPPQEVNGSPALAMETDEAPVGTISGTRRILRGPGGEIDNAANPGSEARTSGGVAPSRNIPPALTQEQIDVMGEPEARQALTAVAEAQQYASGEDRERLKNELKLLLAHLRKVKGS